MTSSKPPFPFRMTQDEIDLDGLLATRWLAPRGEGESLRDCILRIVAFDVEVALNPDVSEAAQRLIAQGKASS